MDYWELQSIILIGDRIKIFGSNAMMKMRRKVGINLILVALMLVGGTGLYGESSKPLTADERNLATQINNIFRRAVAQVGPAVVSIQV